MRANDQFIEVEILYMEHEGGTKFYQVFEAKGLAGLAGCLPTTLTHWGPLRTVRSTGTPRPVQGGGTQIKDGRNLQESLRVKTRPNPKGVYARVLHEKRAYKLSDPWWAQTFGAVLAHEFILNMFPDGVDLDPRAIADTVVSGEVDTTPTDRPTSWGSW